MARFVVGDDRSQSTLFPERLDDYLAEDNPVRAIDVFVDELDLAQLGFGGVEPETTGRPAYHPATLLKIYIYGYLNRVQSSRRLERECQRNIELVWLTGRLMPDFEDHSRLPQGQWRGHPQGLPRVRGAVPPP
jgi:transposase